MQMITILRKLRRNATLICMCVHVLGCSELLESTVLVVTVTNKIFLIVWQYTLPTDKHFLINWLDEEDDDIYDVVPSKAVVPPEGTNVLDLDSGAICRVAFSGLFYRAKVIESGMYISSCRF